MSTDTADGFEAGDSWPVQYLQDHAIHVAVVLVFLAYPFVYDILVDLFALTAEMVLPEPRTMLMIFVLGLFAMSFDFVSGYTGYLSFGHAAFFGVGAYIVVLGYNGQLPIIPAEFPFLALMIVGALVAALFALLVGLLAFRLSGVYFAMITLGIAEIMYVVSQHWDYLTPGSSDPATGTAAGSPPEVAPFEPMIGVPAEVGLGPHELPFTDIVIVPRIEISIPFGEQLHANVHPSFGDTSIFGIEFGEPVIVAYLTIGLLVLLSYLLMQRIIHSPFGRVMIAIRENEERAKAIGYNVFYYKIGAFMISAFFGAIAGALLIVIEGTAAPDTTLFFLVTGFALVASIIGGLGTLAGPLFGYIFLESVNEFLAREASGGGLQPWLQEVLPGSVLNATIGSITVDEAMDAFMTGHGEFYAGIIFVVFVLYVPVGMLGTLRQRLGADTVANSVSQRLGRFRSDGNDGGDPVDADPNAEADAEIDESD